MAERRAAPRTPLAVDCVLRRGKGSPIAARTVEVGPGGMSVTCERPLATDEVVHFDLPLRDGEVDGDARVLREQATTCTRCASRRSPSRPGRSCARSAAEPAGRRRIGCPAETRGARACGLR